jgi:hypothetical protein
MLRLAIIAIRARDDPRLGGGSPAAAPADNSPPCRWFESGPGSQ